jgi:hypothetical protein
MSKSIEIFENTLLKLIIRSGTDSDRKTIVLDSGELGYTTDTNRLYVGNGTTPGGILVGNVFNGSRADVTTGGGNPAIGDLAFDTDNKILYRLESSNFSNLSSWQAIGGVYSAGNNTIRFSSTNTVSVCSLSANNISQDALGRSITLDSGRITLSSTVAVNNILVGARVLVVMLFFSFTNADPLAVRVTLVDRTLGLVDCKDNSLELTIVAIKLVLLHL